MINVGVLGAAGYMGGELIRVLLAHPHVNLNWVSSRSVQSIAQMHPNLYNCQVKVVTPDKIEACDLVFMALPTEASMEMAHRVLRMGCKLIDMGAAFRLKSQSTWQRVYGLEHQYWELVSQAVYGLSELHSEAIRETHIVANPGCFASAAILGMAPMMDDPDVDLGSLVVNGLSGTAGAGAELSRAIHHPEISGNVVPYNVVDHRHSYEIEQELSQLAKQAVTVHFTPVYVPITRGILSVCSVFTRAPRVDREYWLERYEKYYRDHPFVSIFDLPREPRSTWQYKPYPWVSSVNGTNHCFIGLETDPQRKRIVIFSVLDSLGKGGAHVAVENMNLMFGFSRTSGIQRLGAHP